MASKPTVLVTGISGSIGRRLLPHLADYQVIGTDIREAESQENLFRFEKIDLSEERSCDQLLDLIRAYGPETVVHLAFVDNPSQLRQLDTHALWSINVAGTSRVIEAIAEHNRMVGGIEQFVFPSSAVVYGPQPQLPVREEARLDARGLIYALQQQEADLTVQARASDLRRSKTYILRSQFFAGAGVENYPLAVFRGNPVGNGFIARRLRQRAQRLPLLLPSQGDYLEHKFQFVHVDDVARLISYIVHRRQPDGPLTILNVAGRGDALSLRRCAEIAQLPVKNLPGVGLCRQAFSLLWKWGVSDVPAEILPYILGSCVLDTARLRVFLGEHYRAVIQSTCEEALAESFAAGHEVPVPALPSHAPTNP
jgi:nucleoside-diphosphate-sugar epimerase